MKALPEILGRDEFDALIIRTDYGDEAAWQAVVADLAQPWGDDGEFEPSVHLVDNPAWADLTSDEVLNEARRDENLSVVFLADRVTMQSAHRALLALDITEEEELDPVYYQELIDSRLPRVPDRPGRRPRRARKFVDRQRGLRGVRRGSLRRSRPHLPVLLNQLLPVLVPDHLPQPVRAEARSRSRSLT